jgi:predicted O-linked N-acetylglucosamine transferase (SPINDLY family)
MLVFWHTLRGEAREHVLHQFRVREIAEDRLDIRHQADERGYLAVYGAIDIGLDVFPWTGGTTTCEALWMGVPVIGRYGDRHAARGTASILSCVGLGDLVADTPEQYVHLATQLASDRDRLVNLRSRLRQLMIDTLCNGQRFTRCLEDAYRMMWRRWCTQQRER